MSNETNNSRIFLFTESGKPIMPFDTVPTEATTTNQRIRQTARISTIPVIRPIATPARTPTVTTLTTRKRGRPCKGETSKGKAVMKPDEPKRKRGRPRKYPVDPNLASTSACAPDPLDPYVAYLEGVDSLKLLISKLLAEVGKVKEDNEDKDRRIKVLEEEVERMKLQSMEQHRQ